MYNKGAKDKTLNPLKEATAIHLFLRNATLNLSALY